MAKLFQVLSRNNDVNGNPYRLILVYNAKGGVETAYEARSSSPNIVGRLRNTLTPEYVQIPTFHLAPSEYNATKRSIKAYKGVEIQHAD